MNKTICLLSFVAFVLSSTWASPIDGINGDQSKERIIFGGSARPPRLADVQPEGWYYRETQTLTIAFPAMDFEPYTLSVSSAYTTQDYYVTTPSVTVAVYDTDLTIDLQIETEGGDVYWGSFVATAATSTE